MDAVTFVLDPDQYRVFVIFGGLVLCLLAAILVTPVRSGAS